MRVQVTEGSLERPAIAGDAGLFGKTCGNERTVWEAYEQYVTQGVRENLLELLYYTDKPGRRRLLFSLSGAALTPIRSQTW